MFARIGVPGEPSTFCRASGLGGSWGFLVCGTGVWARGGGGGGRFEELRETGFGGVKGAQGSGGVGWRLCVHSAGHVLWHVGLKGTPATLNPKP